jgi:hypothetical protein
LGAICSYEIALEFNINLELIFYDLALELDEEKFSGAATERTDSLPAMCGL